MPVWEREEVQKMLRPAWSLTLAPHAKTSPALRQTPGWLDPDLVLTANLWVQSALTAILWVQLANHSEQPPLKTKGLITPPGQFMGPTAANLWV